MFSDALASLALMTVRPYVTHSLIHRNWRLAISHVLQFSHHSSCILSGGNIFLVSLVSLISGQSGHPGLFGPSGLSGCPGLSGHPGLSGGSGQSGHPCQFGMVSLIIPVHIVTLSVWSQFS